MTYRSRRWRAIPTSESLALIDGADIVPDSPELRTWHESYVANHRVRLATDLDIVREFSGSTSRILEIGSIPLVLTAALRGSGYDVTGCDVDPSRYSGWLARNALPIIEVNIETARLPFDDESFDLILFNEVFEHLRVDPIFTLEEVHRVLKRGGRMLMSTPNLRSIGGLYNLLIRNESYSSSRGVYEQYSKLRTIGHMGHVREYTTREASDFLGKIGFRVEDVLFRSRYRQLLPRLLTAIQPQWLPYVSFVASK